ncbi:MAG: hypothetical protein LC808_24520, partial [Actinobacteria bacterium]|nr:hypothetical protein [Actinomycetota bacterium]
MSSAVNPLSRRSRGVDSWGKAGRPQSPKAVRSGAGPWWEGASVGVLGHHLLDLAVRGVSI